MEYSVIRYDYEDDEVTVIAHRSWIIDGGVHGKIVKVPNRMGSEINMAAKRKDFPKADWRVHACRVVGEYGTWETARKKLPRSMETSDLESTDPEELGRGKRKPRPKRNFDSSAATDSDDAGDESNDPRPTNCKTRKTSSTDFIRIRSLPPVPQPPSTTDERSSPSIHKEFSTLRPSESLCASTIPTSMASAQKQIENIERNDFHSTPPSRLRQVLTVLFKTPPSLASNQSSLETLDAAASSTSAGYLRDSVSSAIAESLHALNMESYGSNTFSQSDKMVLHELSQEFSNTWDDPRASQTYSGEISLGDRQWVQSSANTSDVNNLKENKRHSPDVDLCLLSKLNRRPKLPRTEGVLDQLVYNMEIVKMTQCNIYKILEDMRNKTMVTDQATLKGSYHQPPPEMRWLLELPFTEFDQFLKFDKSLTADTKKRELVTTYFLESKKTTDGDSDSNYKCMVRRVLSKLFTVELATEVTPKGTAGNHKFEGTNCFRIIRHIVAAEPSFKVDDTLVEKAIGSFFYRSSSRLPVRNKRKSKSGGDLQAAPVADATTRNLSDPSTSVTPTRGT